MPERQRILVILNESNNFHLNRPFFVQNRLLIYKTIFSVVKELILI